MREWNLQFEINIRIKGILAGLCVNGAMRDVLLKIADLTCTMRAVLVKLVPLQFESELCYAREAQTVDTSTTMLDMATRATHTETSRGVAAPYGRLIEPIVLSPPHFIRYLRKFISDVYTAEREQVRLVEIASSQLDLQYNWVKLGLVDGRPPDINIDSLTAPVKSTEMKIREFVAQWLNLMSAADVFDSLKKIISPRSLKRVSVLMICVCLLSDVCGCLFLVSYFSIDSTA